MLTLNSRLKLGDDVTVQAMPSTGQTVILSLKTGQLYSCNATTAAFLESADGARTFDQIMDKLQQEFDVPRAKLVADMTGMAQRLLDAGLLIVSGH